MATTKPKIRARPKAGSRSTRRTRSEARKPQDAIQLLKADHKEVKQLFEKYEKTEDDKAVSYTHLTLPTNREV